MGSVKRRRETVLKIISSHAVENQEQLVAALLEEGIHASQASVCRDIAALGLIKQRGRYVKTKAGQLKKDPLAEKLRETLLSYSRAGANLIVLKTPPGEASSTALALDRADLAGVMGTLAGDDTVFVALSGIQAQRSVERFFKSLGV